MLRSKKFKLIISSIFVFVFLSFSITYMLLEESRKDVKGLSDSRNTSSISGVPFIVSLAPISVVAGEEYIYIPLLSDMDTPLEDLELSLKESPYWLFLENGRVKGKAPIDSGSKTYKFVLRVSDGYNSSEQENYIVVLDR
ncbi:MAG TPA: hypothetical protein PLS56_00365 [Candidatus Dojkabacteria bacterium]|jgi:hypothetical protein|nr:hypothetical protein [Candidatus Dojkabacteria bacterium]